MTTILLIDDETYYHDVYGSVLKQAGYDIEYAKNGVEALKKIEGKDYDLLIVDLIMPHMSGMELLKSIKRKKIPTIVFTTLEGVTDKADATKLGVKKFLTKSETTPKDLVKIVAGFK